MNASSSSSKNPQLNERRHYYSSPYYNGLAADSRFISSSSKASLVDKVQEWGCSICFKSKSKGAYKSKSPERKDNADYSPSLRPEAPATTVTEMDLEEVKEVKVMLVDHRRDDAALSMDNETPLPRKKLEALTPPPTPPIESSHQASVSQE